MAISTLTAEHVGMGLMVIGVVIFAGMLTIRLFSSSGDWPLLLPIVIIGVVISYVGFALVLADNSRRARSCECSCTVSPAPAAAGGGEIFQPRQRCANRYLTQRRPEYAPEGIRPGAMVTEDVNGQYVFTNPGDPLFSTATMCAIAYVDGNRQIQLTVWDDDGYERK